MSSSFPYFSSISDVVILCASVSVSSEIDEIVFTACMKEGGTNETDKGGMPRGRSPGKWEWQMTDPSSSLFPQAVELRDSKLKLS